MSSIWLYDPTAASNTALAGINIQQSQMNAAFVDNAFRALMADVAAWRDDAGGKLTSGGTANAQTLTTAGTLTALADGTELAFVAGNSNTGAATLNVNSIGALAIRKVTTAGEVALAASDIIAAGHYTVRYDASANSSAGAWILLNPTVGGNFQPLDSDLTAIAAIAPSNDDVIQRKAGAWVNRTMAQLIADLAAVGTTFQPLDSDLTALAALTTTAAGRSVLTYTDPNVDRIMFWDDSAGAITGLALDTGLSISGTTLSLDAELVAFAGLTSAADKIGYFTGSGTMATTDFTSTARSLLDDTSAGAMRTTLGVGTGDSPAFANVNIDAAVSNRLLLFNTSGSARFKLGINGTAEIGANVGSDFIWNAYDDSGSSLGAVLSVTRATRAITFAVAPLFGDAANTRSNLGAAGTGVSNTFTASQTITGSSSFFIALTGQSTDASASAGPFIILDRNSASPAISDATGSLIFRSRNASGGSVDGATFTTTLTAVTAGAESTTWTINTIQAGSVVARMNVGAGVWVGSAGGTDKGAGTLNAVTLYQNGTALGTAAMATAPTGAIVGDTDAQTLTNKVLTSPAITGSVNVSSGITVVSSGDTPLTISGGDNGAGAAPNLVLKRGSTSPAANDLIGALLLTGRDSGGGDDTYAAVQGKIIDPTATSEDGELHLQTAVAGTLATRGIFGQGLYHSSATGGDKGANTINFGAVYDDNSLLTCAPMQPAFLQRGEVDIDFWDGIPGASKRDDGHHAIGIFQKMLDAGFDPRDPGNYIGWLERDRQLPGMPTLGDSITGKWEHNTLSTGELMSRLWLAVEFLALAFRGHLQQSGNDNAPPVEAVAA